MKKEWIPNILTSARGLSFLAIAAILLAGGEQRFVAAFYLFIGAALTDCFDGWLARRWKAQTAFGTIFDPLCDKLLCLGVSFLIFQEPVAPKIAILFLFFRDFCVDGCRSYLLSQGVSALELKAIMTGKIKTVFQMIMLVSILAFLAYSGGPFLRIVILISGYLAAFFAFWSGSVYLRRLIVFERNRSA